ncbi:MFS transporter [Streptomyces capillispiralis]|uniref:Putative MFS family arabinose efflux permease n=1 Tax=Streptomyces capillispiralis TaxID=68182 RepID=A0A561TBR1_9ACTN|nr:MFS transporter [Streptomyces capillispiralis]TWF84558.1 putative MFS family arabinose efflux permease [Streptomyces capillispiralis]GHH92105.1 MFS transporter [Streptomyces capillispiralis]
MLPTLGDFRRDQLATAALFFFLGFQYATWASRLPALKSRFGLGETQLGLLLMICGVGAAVAFPLIAHLMRRLGSRRLALWSALGLVAVLPALSAAGGYPLVLLVIFLDGVAVGCLNVAMNAQGAALESRHGRAAMAQLHASFSAGSLGGALLASGMNTVTHSLTAHFTVAAVLSVLLLAGARTRLSADDPAAPGPGEEQAAQRKKGPGILNGASRAAVVLGCAMVFGTVTEGAMNDWSALYLTEETGASGQLAPLGIAVVSVMMVLARLVGDGWRNRWGDARMVRVGSTVAGTGLALALLTGGTWPALIGFACVGLGMATVTPCLYVAAAAQGPNALALVAAMGTTGLLAGPALIGFVAGYADLTVGMAVVAASAVLVAVCARWISWTERTSGASVASGA